jgi:uncharacterized protein YjbJ (UPF0337 family)
MEWERISGNWMQWKGRIQERWGRLTEDHLDVIGGRRELLAGRIQQAYGLSREEAERQLRNWQRNLAGEEFDERDLIFDDDDEAVGGGRNRG